MFVSDKPVAITEGDNTIYIKPKMDFGTRNAVIGAAAHVDFSDGKPEAGMDIGSYQTALLELNIVGWSGPAFEGVPCTAVRIRRLDPDEPLVVRVLEEIAARNPPGKRSLSAPSDGSSGSAAS